MNKRIDKVILKNLSGNDNHIVLHDLGKINIICGKNSSGKTTILNAISDVDKGKSVFSIKNISLTHIHEYVNDYYEVNSDLDSKKERKRSAQLVMNKFHAFFFNYNHELNADTFTELVRDFIFYLNGRDISTNTEENQNIGKIINHILSSRKIHFIHPKRKFSSYSNILQSEEIDFSNSSFLTTLFRIKNQLENSDLNEKFRKIKQSFKRITGGYDFNVTLENSNRDVQLYFAYNDGNWDKADVYGLGLYDVLFIVTNIELSDAHIILLEEPENHLHPDSQRKLFYYINEIDDKQFFITTHSNIFLDITFADKIFHTIYDERIIVRDDTNKAGILQDLGYSVSDNLIADAVILIEGPTDKPILEEFLSKIGVWGEYNIRIWALGGDIMNKQDLTVFSDTYKVFALIDSDPKSKKSIREQFEKTCSSLGIHVHRLERYAIENYFSLRALKGVFKLQIPSSITRLDPGKKLQEQINFDCKKNNRKIAKLMTVDELENTDLLAFLLDIKKYLSK